jgi:hypothetical protein
MTLAEIGVLASLALNIGIAIAGATWGIAKIRETVRTEIAAHKEKIDQEIDAVGRSFGETTAAIRQKVHEVELYAANNYVRREGFYKVQETLTADIKAMGDELKKRLERMELKIDSKT